MATVTNLTSTSIHTSFARLPQPRIFQSDSSGNETDDPSDQLSWNPPTFAASSLRALTFEFQTLSPGSSVSILLENLCLAGTSLRILNVPVQADGTAKVVINTDDWKSVISAMPFEPYVNTKGQTIPYHLDGRANSCSLFRAKASDTHGNKATYYYWTMGENETLSAVDPNDANVTISLTDDFGNPAPSSWDQTSWNPPAFVAGSTKRALAFAFNGLTGKEAHIHLQNLSLVSSGDKGIDSASKTITTTGPTAIMFPIDKRVRLYHLNGQPDACTLYAATLYVDGVKKDTYYYWVMGANVAGRV